MAKRIRISADNGTTWTTLPGNSGEISNEAGTIDDTIFGQNWQSQQAGLIDWTISANGLYKGFAGYVGTVFKQGTSTVMTAEATTQVGSTKTWQITSTAKRNLNPAVAVSVLVSATPVPASNIESIDYLFGRVTFISSYTPGGPVTITGAYFPLATLGCFNSYTLGMTADVIDSTCMDTARANSGHRVNESGLKTVSLDVSGIYKSTNGWRQAVIDRSTLLIEINPDGAGLVVARGFFKPTSAGQSGDVGALEEETITFSLSVPDIDLLETPFKWVFGAGHTLNKGVVDCITSWQDGTLIDAAYLPDGTTGIKGDVVVSNVSLSSGLEDMNEFQIELTGSGALAAYP